MNGARLRRAVALMAVMLAFLVAGTSSATALVMPEPVGEAYTYDTRTYGRPTDYTAHELCSAMAPGHASVSARQRDVDRSSRGTGVRLKAVSADASLIYDRTGPHARINTLSTTALQAGEVGERALSAHRPSCDAAKTADEVVDVGHAGVHQFPGIKSGKSQFFDAEDLGKLSDTGSLSGTVQKNGNTRYVLTRGSDVGVDRTTGLPTNLYTVIRKPDGSVLTMFPGASPKS